MVKISHLVECIWVNETCTSHSLYTTAMLHTSFGLCSFSIILLIIFIIDQNHLQLLLSIEMTGNLIQ